jgi:hypothetical protein
MHIRRPRQHRRKGAIAVLAAFLMIVVLACVAFAVDLGYLCTSKGELQRSADSAAMAAAWDLIDLESPGGGSQTLAEQKALATAAQFAALNPIGKDAPLLAADDVTVGYLHNPLSRSDTLVAASGGVWPNAVQVRVQRTGQQNGEVPLFFGRVLGKNSSAVSAQATAAFISSFSGFEAPKDGSNLGILPFALDLETWTDLMNGGGSDDYEYDSGLGAVYNGPDTIREVNLYPQGVGSPGNRGTVDIGGGNNSTSDLARQIVSGISPGDMDALADQGRSLEFNDDGKLWLNGDPGISAGMKDELASIIGDPKMIPIFETVSGNGNNAEYTIVAFVGIRVMKVELTGGNKEVIIQPCTVVTKGGIPAPGEGKTKFIYSPVWLVR